MRTEKKENLIKPQFNILLARILIPRKRLNSGKVSISYNPLCYYIQKMKIYADRLAIVLWGSISNLESATTEDHAWVLIIIVEGIINGEMGDAWHTGEHMPCLQR